MAWLLLCACGGSSLSGWLGTWSGSGTVNTGRQPVTYTGQLTVTESSGQLAVALHAVVPGSGASQDFTCTGLVASVVEAKATAALPASCAFSVTPSDGCTYQATLNSGELTRSGNGLEGTAQGRMNVQGCAGGSITDFSLTLSGTK